MTERRSWTRDELLIAMNLYCKLPFGRLHHGNPDIIALARAMNRTPSSLAMKLSNFASLDPELQARGIKGLAGASAHDRDIWKEFHADWERLGVESERLMSQLLVSAAVADKPDADSVLREPDEAPSYSGPTETERSGRVRLAQRFFRKTVLASYGIRCCITGIPVPELLIASHIVPWSKFREHRANPCNGLCLSRLHDAAFDCGLITFDEQWRLVLSRALREFLTCQSLRSDFAAFEGHRLTRPDRFAPDPALMDVHRQRFFRG